MRRQMLYSFLQEQKVKKKVSFNKIVKVFPIPRKEDFYSVSQDVWYSRDEITRVMFAYGQFRKVEKWSIVLKLLYIYKNGIFNCGCSTYFLFP